MALYRRVSTWWTDFTVNGQRHRLSLDTRDKREAVRLERIRIAEAQKNGAGFIERVAGVTVTEAVEVYLSVRRSQVSASTVRLERDALKQVTRHLEEHTLASLRPETLTLYIGLRRAESIANRTINIEVGSLRRVLRLYRMGQVFPEDYKPLPELRDVGRALTTEQEEMLFSTASIRSEWSVAFWVSLVAANTTANGCELRNLRIGDIDLTSQTMYVKVAKNRFRLRPVPLNQTAMWAVEAIIGTCPNFRRHQLGALSNSAPSLGNAV